MEGGRERRKEGEKESFNIEATVFKKKKLKSALMGCYAGHAD